jgi:hypothetical protein
MGFMHRCSNTREYFDGRAAGFLRHVECMLQVPALGRVHGVPALRVQACVLPYLRLLAELWLFLAPTRHPQSGHCQGAC